MHISAIAAIGKTTRAIGKDGKLVWSLKEDMDRFKQTTMGHPVIMGRKTWESIPERFRPLPGRTNFVISRDPNFVATGAIVTDNVNKAISASKNLPGNDEVFIIGGGEIYKSSWPLVDRLHLTVVDFNIDGDTFFPEYEKDFVVLEEEKHDGFTFQTLERVTHL